ncbi:MAG: DNA adenine methylase [Bdellovibrionaceae bacterium]|nr:DNA adenine methylase [Pseudobdellovibrionaceae bacterium]
MKNTKKGQAVLDPFCGSGMTGLASKLTGRNAFLSDIGSLAIHLASNHVSFCDIDDLMNESKRIMSNLDENSPYYVFHNGQECEVSYVIYANSYKCPKCRKHISSWDLAKQTKSFSVPSKICCTSCSNVFGKKDLNCIGKKAVSASLSVGKGRNVNVEISREPIRTRVEDYRVSRRIDLLGMTKFDENREMHIRSALHLQNVYKLRDFYSDVNWFALGSLFNEINAVKNLRTKAALLLAFTNTAWHGSKMRRFNLKGGHRPLTGTLYFPQLYSEGNVFKIFENKIETLVKYFAELKRYGTSSHIQINRTSAVELSLDDNSIDYIYTDPPFGSNIFYADCNFIAEAWLGSPTSIVKEAVVNRSLKTNAGGKTLTTYADLMRSSFLEMNRVLKKGSKLSLVFNSSTGDVWQALMDSLNDAGFEVEDADLLDKVQLSFKGYKAKTSSENVATTDLVIDLKKKPNVQMRAKIKRF